MADDLVEFLRARLDEGEQEAREALRLTTTSRRMVRGDMVEVTVQPPEWRRSAWPPARVLREVEAKRQLLDLHARHEWIDGCTVCDFASESCGCVSGPSHGYPCDTVKLLALPYADHPDYREEWRP